jgi:hypothetical protein
VSAYLITSKARAACCPVCQEPVLLGVSEGLTVRVDPYPVAPDIELVAIIAGRQAFTLWAGQLVARALNSPLPGPVLITHRCGYVLRVATSAAAPVPEAFVPPF